MVEDERDRSEISSKAAGAELYKIIVEPDPEGGGRVTGSGTYSKGQNVTVEAEPEEGFVFAGWQDDRRIVRSFSRKFEFEVSEDLKLSAVFDRLEKAQFEATLPGTFGNSEAVPQLSPDHTHLLGLQNGMLTLNGFPESNLINTFPAEEKHLIRGFKWAPQGDVFAYHTEHEEPGGSGGVYIAKLDGTTEKIAALDWPELCSRQILWSPCGRYLFWNKPFSIYNRETGELLVRKEIDVNIRSCGLPCFPVMAQSLPLPCLKRTARRIFGFWRCVTVRSPGNGCRRGGLPILLVGQLHASGPRGCHRCGGHHYRPRCR